MDQIDRLIFQVQGQDRGGSKVLDDASKKADAAHLSMSKLGSTLSGLGGPFAQVINFGQQLAGSFDSSISKAQKLGLAAAATGAGLIAIAAKDQQAQRQLQQAVDNTGASYSDYRGQIDAAIKHQEGFAHTADDTQNALNTLVTATQDTTRSIGEMNLVSDIAAAKHESLAEAATQLVQAQAGNTRAFKAFGIVLDTTLPKSEAIDKALKQLTDRLSGQAPASVDTFVGHLKVMETKIHDQIALWGEKYGPAITAGGAALTAVSAVTQILIARRIADTAAAVRETAANVALAGSYDAVAVSATAAGAAQGAAALGGAGSAIGAGMASRIPGALGIASRLAVPAAIAYGTYQTAKFTLAKDSSGLTGEQESKLKQLEAAPPSADRGQAARFYNLTKQLRDYDAQKQADKQASGAAAKANDSYTTSLVKQQAAAAKAAVSIDTQIKALQDSVNKALGLASAEDDLQGAMHTMAQAAHDGGTALHGHTLAAEANRAALRDSVTKMLDVITAMRQQGVGADKVRAAADRMSGALENNATKIYGNKTAVDKLLGSLGAMPGQVNRALTSLDGVFTNMDNFFSGLAHSAFGWGDQAGASFVDGWNYGTTAGGHRVSANFGDPGHEGGSLTTGGEKKKAHDYGKQVAANVVSGYAPAVSSGVSNATSKAMDKAKQQAQNEAQYMHSILSEITSAYQNTKQTLIDQASMANRQSLTDSFGSPMGQQSIVSSKKQFAHEMIKFARLLHRLEDAHYLPIIIDEVEGMGAVAGIEAAQELLKGGRKERRAVDHAERRIERASARISAQVTGEDYLPEIARALKHLPNDLDRALEKGLKHLNINVSLKETARHRGRRIRNKS